MAVSAPVNAAVEAIGHLFASFQPTDVMRDIDPMLEHLPDLFEALKKGLTSLGDKLGDQPVHAAVTDAVRDLIPVAAGLQDAAGQPFEVFKVKHAQEREQHLNPRAGERHWNVNAASA
jgi:hypothetical protein